MELQQECDRSPDMINVRLEEILDHHREPHKTGISEGPLTLSTEMTLGD